LPAIDLIEGCATSLPLKPLRSPDQNDNLFESRSKSNAAKQKRQVVEKSAVQMNFWVN
jgi:hypothetical protein